MTKSFPPKSLVLYADDDIDDQALLMEAFAKFSSVIEMVLFNNGAELLDFLNSLAPFQPQPCLVILDVNMPRLNGKQTLQTLRSMEQYKETPIVLFTTSTLPSEMAFAKAYDAGFITKPLHSRHIQLILDQFIDHCEPGIKEKIRRVKGK